MNSKTEPRLFVSYDRARPELAHALAEMLTDAGIGVWLDHWELVPGTDGRDQIDHELTEATIVALCVGARGLAAAQKREVGVALARREETGRPTVVSILLPGGDASMLPPALASSPMAVLTDGLGTTSLRRLLAVVIAAERDPSATEQAIGDLLQDAGDPEGAAGCYRRALTEVEAQLGEEDPGLGPLLVRLAGIEAQLTHFEDAERLARRALEMDRLASGPTSSAVVRDLNALAYVLLHAEQTDQAARCLEAALEIRPSGRLAPALYTNLGVARWRQGNAEDALDATKRAIESAEPSPGPARGGALNNLGALRREQGDCRSAHVDFQRALELSGGPDSAHPRTAVVLNNLGTVLRDVEDLEGSRDALMQALRIDETAFGPFHPTTAIDQSNLALTLARLGQRKAARETLRQAYATLAFAFGREHRATLMVAENLESFESFESSSEAGGVATLTREPAPVGGDDRNAWLPEGRRTHYGADLEAAIAAAAAGDTAAWEALTHRFTPLLRSIGRGYRLSGADAEDVIQATWVQAFSRLRNLRSPQSFPAWLVTIARRESVRQLRRLREESSVGPTLDDERRRLDPVADDDPETEVLEKEQTQAVRGALARLPPQQRALLHALLEDPTVSYHELSERLGLPVGSIGPTRARAMARLRRDTQLGRLLHDPRQPEPP